MGAAGGKAQAPPHPWVEKKRSQQATGGEQTTRQGDEDNMLPQSLEKREHQGGRKDQGDG